MLLTIARKSESVGVVSRSESRLDHATKVDSSQLLQQTRPVVTLMNWLSIRRKVNGWLHMKRQDGERKCGGKVEAVKAFGKCRLTCTSE